MNVLNELTLDQKGELIRKARLRDRQAKSMNNSKIVQFYFDLDRAEAERLCLQLGLYAFGCQGAIKRKGGD